MTLKKLLQIKNSNCYFLCRTIYNYGTVLEINQARNVGKRAKVQGWVKALRKMKENVFLDVNDGSSSQHLQVVLKKDQKPEKIGYGCSISAEGEMSQAPNGRAELLVDKISIVGECSLDHYPFLPRKQYSAEYIRQYLHLRPRTKLISSTMRLRDLAGFSIREHFREQDFVNVDTPILTSNDCEGAGEVFFVQPNSNSLLKEMKKESIDDVAATYFDTKTFLTVSGQLHLEAYARALSRVFNFCPAFRAENSKSRLHLSEFYMVEAEMAFISCVKELTAEAELLIKSITRKIMEKGIEDLKILEAPEPSWLNKEFGLITYEEALNILNTHSDKLTYPIKHGEGFVKEHELFLVNHHGGIPVFVIDWPKNVKPFYAKEHAHDNSKVKAFDLLAPIVGELIGGTVREDEYEKLKKNIPPGLNLEWYLDLRKFGNVPTAGFGMGFERYLQFITGVTNIKDVIPFPRWPHNCKF